MYRSLCVLLLLSGYCIAQGFVAQDINKFNAATGGKNCTSSHQGVTAPGWEFNCDAGSGHCSTISGPVCANTPAGTSRIFNPNTPCGAGPDGLARELDASWTGSVTGGSIFHPSLNTSGNPQVTPTTWTWGGWFCYTGDTAHIWRLELDLNQIVDTTPGDGYILIYAAQCNMSLGKWQFQNGWGLTSNIKCPTTGNLPLNTWIHLVITAHRTSACNPYVHGQACPITYDSVYFWPPIAGNTALEACTSGCNSTDGRDKNNWSPLGGLIQNVQYDMNSAGTNAMNAYADLMTTHSGAPTTTATPTLIPAPGTYTGPQYVALSTTTPFSVICYTLDGSTPTANGGGQCTGSSLKYTIPIPVSSGETINAIASADGVDFDSAEASGTYTINPVLPPPT